MVKRCAYGTCRSDTRYPERVLNVTFHPFPKPKRQLERCKRWIKACGRPHSELHPGNVTKDTYVCSKHFKDKRGLTEEHPDPIPLDIASAPPCSRKPGRKSVISYEENMDDTVDEDHTSENGTVNEGQATQFVSVKPEPLSDDEYHTNAAYGNGSDWKRLCDMDNPVNNNELLREGRAGFASVPLKSEPLSEDECTANGAYGSGTTWKRPCYEDNPVSNNELLHEGPDSSESVPLKSELTWNTANCWNEYKKDKELDSEERQAYVRSLTRDVKDMCDKLEEVGVESVVMLLDRRTFHCLGLGSSQGEDFLNIQANTKQQFSDHCTGHISPDSTNDVNNRHYDDSGLTSRHVDAANNLKTEDSSDNRVSRGSPGDYAAEDDHDSGGLHDNHIAHSRRGRMDYICDGDDDSLSAQAGQGVARGDFNCKDSGGVQPSGLGGVHSTHRGGVDGPGCGSALPLRQVLAKRKRRGQEVQYQVLAKRKHRGQVQYQVLWVEDLSITWEPASNVPLQLRRGVPYVQDDQRGVPYVQDDQRGVPYVQDERVYHEAGDWRNDLQP